MSYRYNPKLCEEQVVEMRKLRVEQGLTTAELARQFGISQPQAWRIAAGRTWGHVDNPHPLIPKARDRLKTLREKNAPKVKTKHSNITNHRISFSVCKDTT